MSFLISYFKIILTINRSNIIIWSTINIFWDILTTIYLFILKKMLGIDEFHLNITNE